MTTTAVPTLVLYDVADGVARITLDRPDASNALDLAVIGQLAECLQEADQDPSVRAVLLLGSGKVFCAGGDLQAMWAAQDRSAFLAELAGVAHAVVRLIDGLPKPVVCGVQGAAAGAGFSLALGADMVVAGRSAKFVTAYTSIGLTPDTGLSWLLPRAVGQQRAMDLLLTSRPLGAEAALGLGIVATMCDDDEVAETARALAARLAARPSQATAATRRLLRSSWAHTLDEHLDAEASQIARAAGGSEAPALIEQFLGQSR